MQFIYRSIFLIILLSVFESITASEFLKALADSTLTLTKQHVIYDPSYVSIPYPDGDVPADRGVCSDVIIRAYRKLDIDLQKEVHEDMCGNFENYPQKWGLTKPDTNIDHRRVPNLMTFFKRHGNELSKERKAGLYQPGEIVCWDLGNGVTHIGIVSNKKSRGGERYQIIHNIGAGQVLEDCLFAYKIIGHYSYEL